MLSEIVNMSECWDRMDYNGTQSDP